MRAKPRKPIAPPGTFAGKAPPVIPEAVAFAAIQSVLSALGTTLNHYMPAVKADAIEAMRGVLIAERDRAAGYHDAWEAKHKQFAIDRPDDADFHYEHALRARVHAQAIRAGRTV